MKNFGQKFSSFTKLVLKIDLPGRILPGSFKSPLIPLYFYYKSIILSNRRKFEPTTPRITPFSKENGEKRKRNSSENSIFSFFPDLSEQRQAGCLKFEAQHSTAVENRLFIESLPKTSFRIAEIFSWN